MKDASISTASADYSTRDVAERLGMAVRSVQMMVDRGELEAWKTPAGTAASRPLRSSAGSPRGAWARLPPRPRRAAAAGARC